MENFPSDSELKNLVKELSEGRETARQLQVHLNVQSSPHGTRDFLLHKILSSYDQALAMLQHGRPGGDHHRHAPTSDSPGPLGAAAGSPHSDYSDQDTRDQASRKRKAVPTWTQTVRVNPGAGIEGPLDDGYSWRKYGQKDILRAKHPRGYYRCTHRPGQGCLATKQVQRSDVDPNTFLITYRRNHTCNPPANSSTNPPNPNEDPNPLPENPQQVPAAPSQQNPLHREPLFNIQTSHRVVSHGLGINQTPSFQPFDFPSSSNIQPQNGYDVNSFVGNYFPSSINVVNDDFGGLIPNLLHTSESELSPIVAVMTSATSSPALGPNFLDGSSELGSNFGYGNQGYYP